jgi:hypothetical protein
MNHRRTDLFPNTYRMLRAKISGMGRQEFLLALLCIWTSFGCDDHAKGKVSGGDGGSSDGRGSGGVGDDVGGGSHDAGASGDAQSGSAVGAFLADYVRAECEENVRCGGFPDVLICERYMLYNERYAKGILDIDYAVSNGRTAFYPGYANSCLTPISSMPCTRTALSQVDVNAQCAPVLQGTLAAGAICFSNAECAGGGSCSADPCPTDGTCCQSRCTAPPSAPQPLGSACDWSCAAGAYCDRTNVPGTCRAQQPIGQACTSSGDCVAGSACVPDNGAGTCMAFVPDGQACTASGAMCDTLANYCDPVSGTCISRGKPGAACSESAQCLPYAICVAGVCQTRPNEGEACEADAGSNARCLVGTCVQGRCTVAAAPQKPCALSLDGGA